MQKEWKKTLSDECVYCGGIDSAKHTMFLCTKWNDHKEKIIRDPGGGLTADNIITVMLRNKNTYNNLFNHLKHMKCCIKRLYEEMGEFQWVNKNMKSHTTGEG